MGEIIVVVSIAFLVLLLFGVLMAMRKKSEGRPTVYLCSECGERDCLCHREDHRS